jgi:hypothetical protein
MHKREVHSGSWTVLGRDGSIRDGREHVILLSAPRPSLTA